MERKIIHCDADCFYAAIEMRDNPYLRDKPIAVGGSEQRRGVISTCNYIARRFGVRSAMASGLAKKLCPDLIIMPHRFEQYRQASELMRDIFHQYTDLVEPLSLDEAYLDVSGVDLCDGSATHMAEEIRAKIKSAVNITVSAGVSNSKFLAKIASDWQKPDGLFVIKPDQVSQFVHQLPVAKIHGVGKVTTAKLQQLGIVTCGDLQQKNLEELNRYFGSFGQRLYEFARGIDNRPVTPTRTRKSLSVEHTYPQDLPNINACLQRLPELYTELTQRLSKISGDYWVTKAFVKVKYSDFSSTTLERVGTQPRMADYQSLIQEAVLRKPLPVRLLGVGVRFRSSDEQPSTPQEEQLLLFPNQDA